MQINHAALPQKLVLAPIQPRPLPQCWHFAVTPMAGWKPAGRLTVLLQIGDNPSPKAVGWQTEAGELGFNRLAHSVLSHVAVHGGWGQQVPVIAIGGVSPGLNQPATWVAKSNVQMLTLPVSPFFANGPHKLYQGDPLPMPPLAGMNPPDGRFLYICRQPWEAGSGFPAMWFLRPDLSLEDQASGRGFDRLRFWLAAFGVPIRTGKGITTPEALAQLLAGPSVGNVPAIGNAAAICDAYHALPTHPPGLMWTAGRIVVLDGMPTPPHRAAIEFDGAGFHKTDLLQWRNQQSPAVQWHYRQLKGAGPLQVGPGTLPVAVPTQAFA